MNKLILICFATIALMHSALSNAFSMCDDSFDNEFELSVNLMGDGNQGVIEGEYDTLDNLSCGDQLYLRGMYYKISATGWRFSFTTAEGDAGNCDTVFYEGIWQGGQATSGNVIVSNGTESVAIKLSAGACVLKPVSGINDPENEPIKVDPFVGIIRPTEPIKVDPVCEVPTQPGVDDTDPPVKVDPVAGI